MNNDRRKELEALRLRLEDVRSELESIRDSEQEYKDNMPESMQDGDKGSKADEAIESMETACAEIDSAMDSIQAAAA